jgi:lysophospholipase L1-like esterase
MENKNQTRKFWNPFNILLISVFTGVSVYIYIGFFFPNPSFFFIHWYAERIQQLIWFFFPPFVILVVIFYRALYLKQIKLGSVILFYFIIFLLALLMYPYAEYRFSKDINKRVISFHSFLQLTPNKTILENSSNFNIFCLGGSTTEFKDKSGRDWPSLLEEKIISETDYENVNVYNCGKQWYSTQHILTNYIQNLKHLQPDGIIVMENINDFLHNADFSTFSNGEFREDYGHFLGPYRNIIKYHGVTQYLISAVKNLWYYKEPQLVNAEFFQGLVPFERNLKTLIQLAKADSTLVILMTQPNIYKEKMPDEELEKLSMLKWEAVGNGKRWNYETAYKGLNIYNDKIRQIANQEGVEFIDLEKVVPKSLDYFHDDVHYESKAYDLIADHLNLQLQEILKKHNLPKK